MRVAASKRSPKKAKGNGEGGWRAICWAYGSLRCESDEEEGERDEVGQESECRIIGPAAKEGAGVRPGDYDTSSISSPLTHRQKNKYLVSRHRDLKSPLNRNSFHHPTQTPDPPSA